MNRDTIENVYTPPAMHVCTRVHTYAASARTTHTRMYTYTRRERHRRANPS